MGHLLMSQVTGQRVEMAAQLLHDIINDLEGGDMNFDTPRLAGAPQDGCRRWLSG